MKTEENVNGANVSCWFTRIRYWLLSFLFVGLLFWGTTIAATAQSNRISVIVELSELSASEIYASLQQTEISAAALSAATQQQLAMVDAAQVALLPALHQMGAQLLYRNQRVYNGIALHLDEAKLAQLEQLPGVRAVHRVIAKSPQTSSSLPLIGAPALWHLPNGFSETGQGVTIAIIDTGIDYLHVNFGGPGNLYTANDSTRLEEWIDFPNAKVIGGYDFAGDAYNANPRQASYNPIPAPDPDPMDCYGHGTAVAGTAAGYGVTQASATYSGPYSSSSDLNQLKIGPGVAPHAQLYALKVFGCQGSSELVDLAIEWAMDPNGDGDLSDHVDVINLSLGSDFGSPFDMTTIAAENAAAAGVIVVAAAGNGGDTVYVVDSPAVGDSVISVAAGTEEIASFSARGPRRFDGMLKPDLTAPGSAIFTARAGTGSGGAAISGTSLAVPHVVGALALLQQRYPTWAPAEFKALLMNSADVRPNPFGNAYYSPVRLGAGRINLPKAALGTNSLINAENPALVSLSFGRPPVTDTLQLTQSLRLTNRSNEPMRYTLHYLPATDPPGVGFHLPIDDIQVAPQASVLIPVELWADAAAMRRVRDGTLAPTQSGLPRHWLSEASGYIVAVPQQPYPPLILHDSGGQQVELQVDYLPLTEQLHYTVTALTTVTVAAVEVGWQIDAQWFPKEVKHELSAPLAAGQWITGVVTLGPVDQFWLSADALSVRLALLQPTTVGTAVTEILSTTLPLPWTALQVPVYAAPRPASALYAVKSEPSLSSTGEFAPTETFHLAGSGLEGRQPPTDVVSLMSITELHAESGRLSAGSGVPAAQGFADLKEIGVMSAGKPTTLYFAVTVYEPWSSPNEVEFQVLLDYDEDGAAEWILFNTTSSGNFWKQGGNDVFMTALRSPTSEQARLQLPLNGVGPERYDTAIYDTNVLLLPVSVAELALPPGQTHFSFRIESYSRDLAYDGEGKRRLIDSTAWLRYDLAQPAITIELPDGELPLMAAQPGFTFLVDWQQLQTTNSTARGVLLLYHHNMGDARSQRLKPTAFLPDKLYFPLVHDSRE